MTINFTPMKHQKRTERAAQASTNRTHEADKRAALWQIAHSLAAIADVLEGDREEPRE